MRYSIHQGDSLWLDVSGTITGIDADWPGTWTGTWAVVSAITDDAIAAPLASGNLIPYDGIQLPTTVPGQFRLAIPKATTAALADGNVFLVVKVANDTTGYSEIVYQDKLTVIKAGI